MNPSNRGGGFSSPASLANYQFDFGVGSNRASSYRPLKPTTTTAAGPSPPPARPTPTPYQPGRPSWTHQTAAASSGSGLTDSPSMVGDIFGKSWAHPGPQASSSASGIGIPNANPNLFGDLVDSALAGSNRSSFQNTPLRSAPKTSFSMDNIADSLPKSVPSNVSSNRSNSSMKHSYSWGSSDQFSAGISNKMGSDGGEPMKSMGGGTAMNTRRDPFASLADFGSKTNSSHQPMGKTNSSSIVTPADDFGAFKNPNFAKSEGFNVPPPPAQQKQTELVGDSFDVLFSFSFSSSVPQPSSASAADSDAFAGANDWDVGPEFSGAVDGGAPTTELEGLPPPPAGITSSAAKAKGLDNYKQGQYADAIKWLSWAVILLEKSGDSDSMSEVLISRASCYKEVGEYKKAVADCTKVLDLDNENVAVLIQRALLYESTEKYKLGAEDLRMVLKIDPGNRLARSTIHRLTKLAD